MSMEYSLSPPPPPPPPPLPPPAPGPPPPPPASAPKKKLYQTIASSRSPVEGDHTEALLLLSQRESRCVGTFYGLFHIPHLTHTHTHTHVRGENTHTLQLYYYCYYYHFMKCVVSL